MLGPKVDFKKSPSLSIWETGLCSEGCPYCEVLFGTFDMNSPVEGDDEPEMISLASGAAG